jgi:hypothetical protein
MLKGACNGGVINLFLSYFSAFKQGGALLPEVEFIQRVQGKLFFFFRCCFILAFCCLACMGSVVAQKKDLFKSKRSNNDTWFYNAVPDVRYGIDSTIFNIEEFNAMQRPGAEYLNIGNTGSAAYPLVFSPFRINGFNTGYNQFEAYQYRFDSVKIYQMMRPYSQIAYLVGQKVEQYFNGKFAAQHKQRIQYGVDFTRFNSRGTYQNQSTNVNGFSLYGNYVPRNNAFSLQTVMVFNSNVVKENGGVKEDVFAKGSTLISKELAAVNLLNVINNYQEIKWMLKAAYHLGKKEEIKTDSGSYKVTIPTFKIGYAFTTGRDKYKYVDGQADSSYYGKYYTYKDSMKHDASFMLVGNEVFLEFTGQTKRKTKEVRSDAPSIVDTSFARIDSLVGDSTITLRDSLLTIVYDSSFIHQANFKAIAALHFDYIGVNQNNFRDKEYNFYLRAGIQNNPLAKSRILYAAKVAFYFAGYNQSDLRLDGSAGYNFGKFGRVEGVVNYHLTEAPYNYQNYWGKAYRIINNFPKQNVLAFGGNYSFSHRIIGFAADAMYYYAKNYFHFTSPTDATYDVSNANVLVVHAANRLGVKGFHFDNDVWFQLVGNSKAIRLPQWVTRSSIYYERRLFKKVLWFSIGFDVRYNAPFFGNTYHPLSGQFYVQDATRLNFYPVLDWFLNIKVKSLRITMKVDNISSYFGSRGYYTAPGYPAADLAFKMGVSWRFWE